MKALKIFLLFIITIPIIFFYPKYPSAHAYIIKSSPAENQIFSKSPKSVSIEFDEEIQPSYHELSVFDKYGKPVDKGNQHIRQSDSKIIEADLKSNLLPGIYSLRWRVVSSDGHPVDGVIPFEIGKAGKDQQAGKSKTTGYVPGLDLIIIRWMQYLGGSIFAGLMFFSLCVLPKGSLQSAGIDRRYRIVKNFGFILLWVTILLNLPLQAAVEADLSWLKLWHPSVLKNLLTNTLFGKVWIVQVFILVFLMVSSKLEKHRVFKWISFALAAGLLAAKAVTSHAFSAENKLLAISADFLHLLSASIWIGSLIAMVILLPIRKREEGKSFFRGIIHLFFPWGVFSVVTLTATGLYESFLYVPTPGSLLDTNYGRVLLGKVILLLLMLMFAVIHFLKGRRGSQKGWGTSLRGELSAGLIVFVLAVLLTNLPTAMSSPGPFSETKTLKNNETMSLSIGPNVIGENTFTLLFKDHKGKLVTNIEQVSLTFTSLDNNLGGNTVVVPKEAEGRFQAKGMYFNRAGRWNVHVHVLTKSLDDLDYDFLIHAGSQ